MTHMAETPQVVVKPPLHSDQDRLTAETPVPGLSWVFTDRRFITLHPDGTARVHGFDQPDATIHKLVGADVDHIFHTLVIKIPGHSHWSGRSERSYSGVTFNVYIGQFELGDGEIGRPPTYLPCPGHGITERTHFRGYLAGSFESTTPDWQPVIGGGNVTKMTRRRRP